MFGLLRPYKGLDLLAAAWPSVAEHHPDAWLYVVGAGGAGLPAVERLRSSAQCDVRQGFVPEEDVDAWLAAADVAVLPYSKGVYSAVLHRALSHGTPSIASPGLAEQTEHFAAGRIVPLDAPAWTDAMRDALARAPLPRPAPPTGELTAAGTVAIYRELIRTRDRRH
jgi:glycosyltransferase involved in cell wall biosynthesis